MMNRRLSMLNRRSLNSVCVLLLFCSVMFFCTDPDTVPEGPVLTETSALADSISSHLHFLKATQISGNAPTGPVGNSLMISFKDTLYLTDTLTKPIKFFHQDPDENLAGVYLQVFIGGAGGVFNASHYYDVPEQEETADSDTVSIVMMGIDERDLPLPVHCRLRIVPHDKNGDAIAESIREVVIAEIDDGSSGISGGCSLVLPPDESWVWDITMSYAGGSVGLYGSETVIASGGQEIQGCCIEGVSDSGPTCLNAAPETRRTLHFPTTYRIASEWFKFFDDGTFVRSTVENTANPVPAESNFCGNGPGVVRDFIGQRVYNGKWEVVDAPPFLNDTRVLTFNNTTSTGTGAGFGHRGGYIRQLDCRMRVLVLTETNPEGGSGLYTLKVYMALKDDQVFANWYPF